MNRGTLLRRLETMSLATAELGGLRTRALAADAQAVLSVGAYSADNVATIYCAQHLRYFREAGLATRISKMAGRAAGTVAAGIGGSLTWATAM
jgi:ABC-type nitrate/sulfonate/bicarbonate transport system substrate-binding protein